MHFSCVVCLRLNRGSLKMKGWDLWGGQKLFVLKVTACLSWAFWGSLSRSSSFTSSLADKLVYKPAFCFYRLAVISTLVDSTFSLWWEGTTTEPLQNKIKKHSVLLMVRGRRAALYFSFPAWVLCREGWQILVLCDLVKTFEIPASE